MRSTKQETDFLNSEAGMKARQVLELMVKDTIYNTEPSHSANTEMYPDNMMPFVDKHMNYLSSRSTVNPDLYLSNLRLMTRIRFPSNSR